MRPPVLFLLAILTPVALCSMLLAPLYASVLGAVYIIYMPASGPHPLAERLLDVFYISNAYEQLLTYWLANMGKVSFVEYTLPVIGLPLVGVVLAIWGTYKLASKLLNIFHLSASI